MKTLKTILSAAGVFAIAALAMTSCSKEDAAQANGLNEEKTISVSVSGLMGEYAQNEDTKAGLVSNVRVSWTAGDKVYAFDGSQCLGELNVSLKDGNDYYAQLTGDLLEPVSGTTKITLVYATGYSATQGQAVTDGKLSFNISSQSSGSDSKNTPFVAFGTLNYTTGTPSLDKKVVDFTLATSVMRLNCTGLEASAAITGAKLKGMSNNCVLNVTNAGVELGQGAIDNISLTFADDFKASASGAQVLYAAIAKNGTASEQILEVKQTKTYEWSFGSKTRDAAKSINTICQLTEKIIPPYVEIPAKYDGEHVTTLKWYRQNIAITTSGNMSWKGGNDSAVKVPGTDEYVIIGDFFQWATHVGHCGIEADADKGLLIYTSFTNRMTDGSEATNAFEFKSPETGKKYWFGFKDSDDNNIIGNSPYYNKTAKDYRKYTSSVNLEKSDDVANIILGGSWRMPTSAEFKAMRDATYWAWDATDCGYYVFMPLSDEDKGHKSYESGYPKGGTYEKANAVLFFPAAGYGYNSNLSGSGSSIGYYWSSSLDFYSGYSGNAWYLNFRSDYVNPQNNSCYRSYGLTVRPVSD